jgi:hypothetical protein
MENLDLAVFEKSLEERLSDKWWRLNNLYHIKDKSGNKVLFVCNYAQERFFRERHGFDLILKARQQGFTTFSCIDFLDDCLFTANMSAGIIAHNLEDANDFFENKIQFAYEHLDEKIKAIIPAVTDRAGVLKFDNGSSIRVRTSFRSGTLQRLHISEFGKICAKAPDKAREIVTGALNAVAVGMRVVIESTAEGKIGYFYEYCERAMTKARLKESLSSLDFKFHFYAWHESPEYVLHHESTIIPQRLQDYFGDLELNNSIKLSPEQKIWYVKKEELMKEDMGREYPSFPDEAFAQSIEGAYFSKQFRFLENNSRIIKFPCDPILPVHTAWDLGWNDATAVWFFQIDPFGFYRFIEYMEASERTIPQWIEVIKSRPYRYGKFGFPHDVEVTNLETGNKRSEVFRANGIHNIQIIPAMPPIERIQAARLMLEKTYFNEANCKDGIELLKQYRKEWDDKAGVWKEKPVHDHSSHCADSFGLAAFMDVENRPVPRQRVANNKYR